MNSSVKFTFFLVLSLAIGTSANIIPSNSGSATTNDPFVRYQWAIKNEGQSVRKDLDDIHSQIIESNPQVQIGWTPELDLQMKKDVIVAVIDSGLDAEHEDLKGRIALNEKECKDGRIQNGPTGDPDGNGFEGDCQGWSFVSPDKKRARYSDDEIGHGTHIAGIIAAGVNNKIGISGLSNRIKILPLKVYDAKEERGSTISRIPLSERVAQAVEYAILRNAHVINLSLGWPAVINTERVKNTIEKAITAGIIVVAGAGNDRHEKQIFPCSYENVLCVGSIDLNGDISRFSNFGGHVDILAPGGSVLSTFPSLLVSNIFGPKGYEIMSGTSQATPYVAGAAALLKGIFPNSSPQELIARLLKSTVNLKASNTSFLRGIINIKRAIDLKNAEILVPSFKLTDRVLVNSKTGQFSLPVKIKSYFKKGSTKIELHSLNQFVKFSNSVQSVAISAGETTEINVVGYVSDLNASSTLEYQLVVDGITYSHQLALVREIPQNLRFELSDSANIGLSTVKVFGQVSESPQYFSLQTEAQGLNVILYALGTNSVIKPIGKVFLPRVSDLLADLSVLRVDLNYDGQLDYLIGGKIIDPETKELKALQYSYIDSQFSPMFGSNSHFILDYESVVPNLKGLKFGRYSSKELGDVAVPVFFAEGIIPKLDVNPDPFSFEQNHLAWRLYYLEPTLSVKGPAKAEFKTRSFFNAVSLKKFKKQLGITVKNDFLIQSLLAQSSLDFITGNLKVLASTGNGINRRYLILKIEGRDLQNQSLTFDVLNNQGIDLQRQATEETLGFNSAQQLEFNGTNIVGIFSQHKARTVNLSSQSDFNSIHSVIQIDLNDREERVVGLIKTFEIDSETISFFEADTTLHAIGHFRGQKLNISSPIYRSSFLPGQFFTQRFTPVLISDLNQRRLPGLLVDNSPVFAPVLSIWTFNANNELVVPVRLNFEIPSNCRAMNPINFQNSHHAVLTCREANKNISLRLIPLN